MAPRTLLISLINCVLLTPLIRSLWLHLHDFTGRPSSGSQHHKARQAIDDPAPVSYTHLDVYKRQHITSES